MAKFPDVILDDDQIIKDSQKRKHLVRNMAMRLSCSVEKGSLFKATPNYLDNQYRQRFQTHIKSVKTTCIWKKENQKQDVS